MTGAQLWAKDLPLDAAIHAFTVGEDPLLDLELLPFDCLGSAAHARMLAGVGLLSPTEVRALLAELERLHERAVRRELVIDPQQEDGHTLIEAELTAALPEAGARIHTGRSRNDQVTLAQNLWTRARCLELQVSLLQLAADFLDFARRHAKVAIPGYTHLQRAMPSSFGQWAAAFAEALIEEADAANAVLRRLDHCPLGAAAGYGVPLPLDRDQVARLLGFSRVHLAPPDAIAGRLRHAQAFAEWTGSIAGVLERFAWDLSLYCSSEFGFVRLATEFTTGSSIMPQKRNPDVVELLRARCRQQRAFASELQQVGTGLPSGYHRDFQLCKGPTIRAGLQIQNLLAVTARVLEAIEIQHQACAAALSPELYATAAACARVRAGVPFREAYRAVAADWAAGTLETADATPTEVSLGAPQRLGLKRLRQRLRSISARTQARRAKLELLYSSIWIPQP